MGESAGTQISEARPVGQSGEDLKQVLATNYFKEKESEHDIKRSDKQD